MRTVRACRQALLGTERRFSAANHAGLGAARSRTPSPSVLLETQIVELTVSGAKDLGLD
jgi:hypothetical protein